MRSIALVVHDADGTTHRISGRVGASLMQAVVAAGLEGVAADCGGCLTCATCHVIVAPAWRQRLPPPASDENSMLDLTAHPREAGSRLSCQVVLTAALDGLEARLPPTQY